MPVIRQKFIRRADLQANPNRLYLFGDNEVRRGFGGQAREMRGEPNAIGIRTKRAPTMAAKDMWREFTVPDKIRFCAMVDADIAPVFDHVRGGGIAVIPEDGIGTGLAQLKDTAPVTFEHLKRRLAELQNI